MNVQLHENFQAKLKIAMRHLGLTQHELADRMGWKQTLVSRYATGKVCPGLDVVEKFAEALSLDAPYSLVDDSNILDHIAEPAGASK